MAASEGRANGRRPEMPPNLPNGESKTQESRLRVLVQAQSTDHLCYVCPPDTPRRRTRRTSGLYDSDRVSNGQHTFCFLSPLCLLFLTAVCLLQRILETLQRTARLKNPPTKSCRRGE